MKKEEIRRTFLARRKALPPGELSSISELVCNALFSNFQLNEKKISLFLPIERANELNTYFILDKAMNIGAEVAVPKINSNSNELKHIQIDENTVFELSNFGIPEPVKGRTVSAEHIDFVIVPMLAADKNGYRVGYGKGYYDRFLKRCSSKALFIGITHFDDLVDGIEDVHSRDVKLHICITPNQIYRFDH